MKFFLHTERLNIYKSECSLTFHLVCDAVILVSRINVVSKDKTQTADKLKPIGRPSMIKVDKEKLAGSDDSHRLYIAPYYAALDFHLAD